MKKIVWITLVIFMCMVPPSYAQDREKSLIQQELDRIEGDSSFNEEHKAQSESAEDLLRSSQFYNSQIDVLDVKNLDINSVLDMISAKTGFQIVADNYFSTKITIYLTEIDVFDSLRIILDANGLAYHIKGGIIYVLTADSFYSKFGYRFGKKLQTKIVPLVYGDSEEIMAILLNMKSDEGNVLFNESTSSFILIDHQNEIQKMIELIGQMDIFLERHTFLLKNIDPEVAMKRVSDILTKNIGRVHLSNDQKSLIVKDVPSKLNEVEAMISSFENENKHLIIQTKVIQITLNDEHLDGIDWSAIVSNYHERQIQGFYAEEWANDQSALSIGTILSEDYDVLIEALDTVGLITEVSENRDEVVTADTAEVVIHSDDLLLSETSYIKTNKKRKNEQARFFIRPLYAGDDMIRLDIAGMVVDLDSPEEQDKDLLPAQLRMKIGDTVVIGGLYKEELIAGVKRIPIVGKIPFLGSAFKKHKHNMKKTEVVIFVAITEKKLKKEGVVDGQ